MNPHESPSGGNRADAKSTIFELLQGTVEKDDMSEAVTNAKQYLVMHSHLSSNDILCYKAGETKFILVPKGCTLTEEDQVNLHVKVFERDVGGHDIYIVTE
jgi:hypothetical protein